MKKIVILLSVIIFLYIISSFSLHLIYGDSYPFLQGEDCWLPDGSGGWVQHGQPAGTQPEMPSVNIPVPVKYIPIFLPALVLILFYFTPVSRKLDSKTEVEESDEEKDDNIEKG